ncbi:N-6 DNA methylase [Micromonospora aurantiaca (nom. illeg.)]|uniref:restriction endonuclease subunit M n=1 Tax=Micromonospora aurantiaca (nom. illeg.) TaxID=47850 RepID=UPI003DA5FD06
MSMVGVTPAPDQDFPSSGRLHQVDRKVWVPLRRKWVDVSSKPEELVRQEWIRRLVVDGGYSLPQMDQERRTQHGRRSPRADIVVWANPADKVAGKSPVLVVETKAGDGLARHEDFWQGESYARASEAGFLIIATANTHTVFQIVRGIPGSTREINDWPKAADVADAARLSKLVARQRTFDRDEFQRLLFECHSLLRDAHAMTPDRAFDTMSKVLFVKLHVERTQTHETFTTEYLDRWAAMQLRRTSTVHDLLFEDTKDAYSADDLFNATDKLDISEATFRQLVSKLERFNLSKTGEDVKGIAFEKFLGRTFRGELGQFFTPRPVVEFMIRALNPREKDIICDPAAGSGGFLIAAFDHVRAAIAADIEAQRQAAIERISSEYPDDAAEEMLDERDARIDKAVREINRELMPTDDQGERIATRVGRLAWEAIFGSDKEPRAARTAKMNMIMHGDGHGGIHWHDGLVDVNGIFDGRFHVVVTNPPFGATVNRQQRVGDTRESDVEDGGNRYRSTQKERYGDEWETSHARVLAARGQPILDLYEIGRGQNSRQTETLFVERCLNLLHPGGRMAIILPNGNLNAASLSWLRRWTEGKAFLRGVVALPAETFKFSRASVSASVVFLQKFTERDAARWEAAWTEAATATDGVFDTRRSEAVLRWEQRAVDGNSQQLQEVLEDLAAYGIRRCLPAWKRAPAEGLVRGAGTTRIGSPVWTGTAAPRGSRARDLKNRYSLLAAGVPALSEALKELRAELRIIDDEQTEAMWKVVRTTFDYSVFMAKPTAVGITTTGDTGDHVPNDLPKVLAEWRRYVADIPGWPA